MVDPKIRECVHRNGQRVGAHDLEFNLEDDDTATVLVSDRLQRFVLADPVHMRLLMLAIEAAVEEAVGTGLPKEKVQ